MKLIARVAPALLVSALCLWANASRADDAPAPPRKLRIVLVGDSTMTDKSGWGLGFKQFVNDRAECFNTSAGGRSSKSFINEGRWKQALSLKGDYYLIQFGHNDQPGKGPERETDPDTTFTTNMTRYVMEARAIGAKPILLTPLTRRQWDKKNPGKIDSTLTPYAEAVKRIAAAQKVPLVDLHARSIAVCEKLGRDGCLEFSPMKTENGTNSVDNTHLNAKGSVLFAGVIVEDLRGLIPELKPCFRAEPAAAESVHVENPPTPTP